MKNFRLMVLVAAAAMAVTGCASSHMAVTTIGPNDGVLAKNQAAIVFFRDTSFGGAIQAPVVESLDQDVAFVGIVSANTRLMHKTTPGKHFYVVGGESSSLLEADLAPQKFYYVRVDPKMGAFKARFALEPVDAADAKLPKALSGCSWVAPGATAQGWFNENKGNLKGKSDSAATRENKAVLKPYNGSDRLIQ